MASPASSASTIVPDGLSTPELSIINGIDKSSSSDSDTNDFTELKQRRAEMAAVADRILALYDAGVPLFTRENLRNIALQLDRDAGVRCGEQNATITVAGMDGRQVRLTTQSGAVSATAVHPDIVLVKYVDETSFTFLSLNTC